VLLIVAVVNDVLHATVRVSGCAPNDLDVLEPIVYFSALVGDRIVDGSGVHTFLV